MVEAGPLLPPGATANNCTDFGKAWCAKARQCLPILFETHGGEALCPDRMRLWCETFLTAPQLDTNWTGEALKMCMTSWSALTCADWQDTNEILVGPACVVPGKRPDGAPCSTFSPCASTFCTGVVGDCGRCAPRLSAGAPCGTTSQCQRGLVCSGTMKCALGGNVGAPCDAERPCRLSLVCKGGVCSEKAGEGTGCTAHSDCRADLLCSNSTNRCGLAIAAPMCDSRRVDGTTLYCAGGGRCDAGFTGMCFAASVEGGVCSDTRERCLFPSSCVAGRCALPVRAACAPSP
jgi:hypothetical protein